MGAKAGSNGGTLRFHTTDSSGNLPERVRIDSSGNVGIGNTNPDSILDISAGSNLDLGVKQLSFNNFSNEGIGITFSRTSSDADLMAIGVVDTSKLNIASRSGIIFSTGGGSTFAATSEAARFVDTGAFRVGSLGPAYSTNEKATIVGGTGIQGLGIRTVSAVAQCIGLYNSDTSGTLHYIRFAFGSSGVQAGAITSVGATMAYGGTSDYRLKENVTYDFDGLGSLKKLKPAKFSWIDNPDLGLQHGFIAHEVDEVVSEAVVGEKDAVNEDGSIDPQMLDQSKLIPVLVKAIQEQQAQIESLQAEVEALKNG